jgi:hypothetical protein
LGYILVDKFLPDLVVPAGGLLKDFKVSKVGLCRCFWLSNLAQVLMFGHIWLLLEKIGLNFVQFSGHANSNRYVAAHVSVVLMRLYLAKHRWK